MTKITIFSGFLGAGKTTLIKKLITDGFCGEKLVLIENEFGEIGIDGGFMKDAGIEVTEMNSGCICCSLVGDFGKALEKVLEEYHPDRILIEPSGVGKLSDVISAVKNLHADVELAGFVTVADANKAKMYLKNFGEFYSNQIENASAIILSRTDGMNAEKLTACVALLREKNADAPIVTTPWEELSGAQIVAAMEQKNSLHADLESLVHAHEHHHEHEHDAHCACGCHDHEHEHHHEHEHDADCACGCHDDAHEHHHEHNADCECGCHDDAHEHHHEHDADCECGCHDDAHEHHHEHDAHCACGCHDDAHEHHHEHEHDAHCECGCHDDAHEHHHADEVFQSIGAETSRKTTAEELKAQLTALDSGNFGTILRAKGILPAENGGWLHFDYVPDEHNIRIGTPEVTGRLCVIGAGIDEAALRTLFHL